MILNLVESTTKLFSFVYDTDTHIGKLCYESTLILEMRVKDFFYRSGSLRAIGYKGIKVGLEEARYVRNKICCVYKPLYSNAPTYRKFKDKGIIDIESVAVVPIKNIKWRLLGHWLVSKYAIVNIPLPWIPKLQ